MKPTYVLGTGLSHDGSACLLRDGVIRFAIEKERLTGRKHDGGNDDEAIRYCLAAEGIGLDDVDLIVQNANLSMFERGNAWFRGPRMIAQHPHVVSISHHLAHAFSALGTAPFDEMSVLVVDGCGNAYDECIDRTSQSNVGTSPPQDLQHLYFEKDSYYHFDGRELRTIAKDFSEWGLRFREYPLCPTSTMHSIGGLYHAASVYCFGGIDDSGKLMGLAPYGRPGIYRDEIFNLRDGRVFVDYSWMKQFDRPCRTAEQLKHDFQYYADIAYWVQREVERALLYLVNDRFDRCASRNLAYAGGVALNAVANRRILRESRFENLYLQPAAGDNGLAVGCAYYGWFKVLGRPRQKHDGACAFGRRYGQDETLSELQRRAELLHFERPEDPVVATAQALAQGLVVGWFEGRSEFGPRALGHRSILADPRRPGVRDHINANIKFREDFRPFAPSVLEEHAERYFDSNCSSAYMLLVAPVREAYANSVGEIVHVDGSARLQTVSQASEPTYHRLIEEFGKLSGLPIVLNTSFNRRGMPIVETPDQAIEFFLKCALDVLVIDGFVVRKRVTTGADQLDGASQLRDRLREFRAAPLDACGICQLTVRGVGTWSIDMVVEPPRITPGENAAANAWIELSEADLQSIIDSGREALSTMFAAGRLRVRGSMRHAKLLMRALAQH
jgi:carbamoyltransferase